MSAICSICGSDMTVQDREGTAFCLSCENAGLHARIAELEAAAQPFARIGWPAEWEDTQPVGLGDLTVGDFRRLASAMKGDADGVEGHD